MEYKLIFASRRYAWFRRALTALTVATMVSACGGGGSSDTPTNPQPPANRAPEARIAEPGQSYVGFPVTLDARGSTDPDNDPLSFEWRLVSAPAGSSAKVSNATQAVSAITPDVAGTYDLQLKVSDSKAASKELPVRITASATPTITANMPEPVTGQVQLVLSGSVPGTIAWSVDQIPLGTTTGTAVATWPSALMANGEHVVLARITQADGSTLDIQRRIVSSNNQTGLVMAFKARPGADAFNLNVSVTSQVLSGVKQVQVTLGGKDLGTVSTVTECSGMSTCDFGKYYPFTISPATLPSGRYSGQVSATDILGIVTRWNIDVEVTQYAQITNMAPANGVFLPRSAMLTVSSTITSDPGKAVNASVAIDTQNIFSTTFSSGTDYLLSTQYNLGQLTTGVHSVSISAGFTTGANYLLQGRSASIAVLPQGESPISPLPGIILASNGTSSNETLLATDDVSALVMRSETSKDTSYREVMLDGGTSTALPGTFYSGNILGMANRRIYILDYLLSRCGSTSTCISEWSAAEGWRNVSGTTYPVGTQAKFSAGQVAWISNSRLVVFDGSQKKYSTVDLPKTDKELTIVSFAVKAGVGYAVVKAGDEVLYLVRSDQTAAETLYSRTDWTVDYAVTDGNHVGWRVSNSKGLDREMLARSWSASTAQPSLITTYAERPLGISNGNFVWLDAAGIRTTSLISSKPIVRLTAYGNVAIPTATGVMFESSGALMAWNSSTGGFQTLLGVFKTQDNTAPTMTAMETDKALLFQFGSYVYRVTKP